MKKNESTYPAETGCSYGEKYEDEHLRDFADGTQGCLKHLKIIERDFEIESAYPLTGDHIGINSEYFE